MALLFLKRAYLGPGHPVRVPLIVRNIQVNVPHIFRLGRSQNLAEGCYCGVFPLGVKGGVFRDVNQNSANQHRLDDISDAQDWLNWITQPIVSGLFDNPSYYVGAGALLFSKYFSNSCRVVGSRQRRDSSLSHTFIL